MTLCSNIPRYTIYIPSKGRFENCLLADALIGDGIPFKLVVEPMEADRYSAKYGKENVIVLPFENLGLDQITEARNFIKDYSTSKGEVRHWKLDDNIRGFFRRYKSKRMYCNSGVALRVCEDFTDRYENVALSGLNYDKFTPDYRVFPVFRLNCHIYSCILILNSIPNRFRGPRNEDVDMCLQVLAGGWCTIQLNIFLALKQATMTMNGGNSTLYFKDKDSRLKISRGLERRWPGVVSVDRRFSRPHHIIDWTKFKHNTLIRKPGLDIDDGTNEYNMSLVQVKDDIKSPLLRDFMENYGSK